MNDSFKQSLHLFWDRFLTPIDDPTSRLFHLNILFSILFILIWSQFNRTSLRKIVDSRYLKQIFFNKKYWWNKSTRTDYQLYFLNSVLKIIIFIPYLDFTFRLSVFLISKLNLLFPQNNEISTDFVNLLVFSIFAFVFDDFLRFLHHYLMHRIPILWSLHKVHHSATVLTPITLYRTHPLESAIATIRNSFSLSVITVTFVFVFQTQLTMVTIFGINFFGFLFNLMGSNLRHSHIGISFGVLEKIFISPKQHQIHHSRHPDHFDKNLGVSLTLWDQVFGTYIESKNVKKIKFGL